MPILDVQAVKKSYISPDGVRTTIVDVPEFAMEEGQHVALAGTSGSGKTTLLNLIAGILVADAGDIFVNGENVTEASETKRDAIRANHIGYIFQTFNLLQGYTALENVELGMMFGRGKDPDYAKALLDRVGLSDRMDYRPRQLSVGQQQRVAVARALANHPKLVLADEPTGNLDHRLAHDAMELVREICAENKAALLLVTHDREMLELFEDCRELADINVAVQLEPGQ